LRDIPEERRQCERLVQGLRGDAAKEEMSRCIGSVIIAVIVATPWGINLAGSPPHSGLEVTQAWTRATPPGMTMGVGYFAVRNPGKRADQLVGASSPLARVVEVHRTIEEGGVSRMRPAKTVEIGPGKTVVAEPGGLHLMLIGLSQPLVEGQKLPVTLEFRNAGKIAVSLNVRSISSTGPSPAGANKSAAHSHQ
jgi:copper(I)-binding protein